MSPRSFVEQYEAALGTQDWATVAPLIHDDARVVFSNGTLLEGKAAIQRAYTHNFATIKGEDYRVDNVHWLVEQPETAAYMFAFRWAGVIQGRQTSGAGRGTTVLVHTDTGWQLVAEHLGPLA